MPSDSFIFDAEDILIAMRALDEYISALATQPKKLRAYDKARQSRARLLVIYRALLKTPSKSSLEIVKLR